jgi:hypothetical protein
MFGVNTHTHTHTYIHIHIVVSTATANIQESYPATAPAILYMAKPNGYTLGVYRHQSCVPRAQLDTCAHGVDIPWKPNTMKVLHSPT